MSSQTQDEDDGLFQKAFDDGFEIGMSDEVSKMLGEHVSASEMAYSVRIGGLLAGLAIRIADILGEDNSLFALQQAQRAVAIHCEYKRAGKRGN